MRRRHERRPPISALSIVTCRPRDDVPPLLLLHGTGGDENDLLPLGCAPRAGRRLAVAARQSSGKRHAALLPARSPKASGIWQDLQLRTDGACAIPRSGRARPMALPPADRARLLQWRECRLVADAASIRRTLGGAILMRAMLPFDPRPLPDLDGIPVLILAGRDDPLVPRRSGRLCLRRCSARPAPTSLTKCCRRSWTDRR